jgi:hypothetical protein
VCILERCENHLEAKGKHEVGEWYLFYNKNFVLMAWTNLSDERE